MTLLTPKEMGDAIDLDTERTYPCSDGGGFTTTFDVGPVARAQLKKVIAEIEALDKETEDESSFAQEVLWWLEMAKKELERKEI